MKAKTRSTVERGRDMKRGSTLHRVLLRAAPGLFAAAAIGLCAAGAVAQSDPTQIGAGQTPYIMVFIDTSASMEWTDRGDDEFPTRDISGETFYDSADYPPGVDGSEWVPGTRMEIGDEASTDPILKDRRNGPTAFGPCIIWEPRTCGDYHRPPWNGQAIREWSTYYQSTNLDAMKYRFFDFMRGNGTSPGVRLDPQFQPRHVSVKEILTGDMILRAADDDPEAPPTAYDRVADGPGCWFVPRQRNASIQTYRPDRYICHGDGGYSTSGNFGVFPDHDEPRPHFQEVFDFQLRNGMMDTLGTSAIFGLAMFDGYRDPPPTAWPTLGFNDRIDDQVDGTIATPDEGETCLDAATGTSGPCYDLGVFRFVSPNTLQIPTSYLSELSAFTQLAMVDAGYLAYATNDKWYLDPDEKRSRQKAWLGATFSKGFKKYIDPHDLGKQPIARATPLAAGFRDIYQFFGYGQNGVNAFSDDTFSECRPKHVVTLTDGAPFPERDGFSTGLYEAFGYDEYRYIYGNTEEEIDALVNDPENIVPPAGSGFDPKFGVRVHIVGLNVAGDTETINKVTTMAEFGRTCAGYYLGPEWKPAPTGTCDPARDSCLVPQTATQDYVRPDGSTVPCDFPALILDDNDTTALQTALFQIFSGIIGASGLASRTRAVVTHRLDDRTVGAGGQYRFFSGVRIGGSPYWKGIINRQTLRCDGTEVDPVPIHDEVSMQVDIAGSTPRDNRRVFTSVPSETIYDYANKRPRQVSTPENSMFVWDYELFNTQRDEFGDTYLPAADGDPSELVGRRVPFDAANLYAAYSNSGSVNSWAEFYDQINIIDDEEFELVLDTYRGRVQQKVGVSRGGSVLGEVGRTLGGILNSNPITVPPPNLDLPIGSYREFRAQYAERPTMLYAATMDGMLHAIHTGTLQDAVRVRPMTDANDVPASDLTGDAADQREAWAYVPHMLLNQLASTQSTQPYFIDGSPVVKDVRLCQSDASRNQNQQACEVVCDDPTCSPIKSFTRWRTVLVQGMGLAGEGYFALDVTRPGGPYFDANGDLHIKPPDPVPLWEFNREWERAQVRFLAQDSTQKTRVRPATYVLDNPQDVLHPDCGLVIEEEDELWRSPLLGRSVSEPEIATVLLSFDDGGVVRREQRPVAIFGGGANYPELTGCGSIHAGKAIYVVDLQTGSIIRRFVTYFDDNGSEHAFLDPGDGEGNAGAGELVGSPIAFDASSGAVATRAFIGDSRGRLFRMDFTDPDPRNWRADLFFDPNTDSAVSSLAVNGPWGPAAYKPTVALGPDRRVVVVYGLGEVGDTVSNDQTQAVMSLTEDLATRKGELNWIEVLDDGEKLTGAPVIFNRVAYFPTYALPNSNVCESGRARIWALHYLKPAGTSSPPRPLGVVDQITDVDASSATLDYDSTNNAWFGPLESTLIRGLTLTLAPVCSVEDAGTDSPSLKEGQDVKPQLIAQTSGQVQNEHVNPESSRTVGNDEINRMVVDLPPPRSQTIPLGWSVISN